nr:MAG TPA: hypothetical protein [Caudoviricetes sp.]
MPLAYMLTILSRPSLHFDIKMIRSSLLYKKKFSSS